jgi:glycosyltransferase involved in cell wall biosynthesis
MTNKPKVSIITPSYNQAQYLEECILSVLEQDYPYVEYIIMDGGSTDGSIDIIKKYEHHLAYWVSQKDNGQSAAINEGLRRATGEIWAWMNSDDAYLPGAIGTAVECFNLNPKFDIIYGDALEISETGESTGYLQAPEFNLPATLIEGLMIPSGSTFIRQAVHNRIGGFDETLHYVMDTDYWLRSVPFFSFEHVSKPLSLYRIYPGAKTWDVAQSEKRALESIRIYENFWAFGNFPGAFTDLRSRSLANAYLSAAHLSLRGHNRNLSIRYFQKSLSCGVSVFNPHCIGLLIRLVCGDGLANLFQDIWHKKIKKSL